MVSFTCNACGQTVRKNQVEKHYQSNCPNCEVLSCIDCGKDFYGEEYSTHTSCISEAEKYQGKLYKPKDKQNKGEHKQQEWIKSVKEASGSNNQNISGHLRGLLRRIGQYSNVPRKKAKFQNFCRNSLNVLDEPTLDQLWEIFSGNLKGGQDTEKDETNTKSNENEAMSKVAETNQAEKCKTTKKSSKKNKTDVLDANGEVSRKGKKRKLKDAEESDSDRQKNKTKKQRGKDKTAESEEVNSHGQDDSDSGMEISTQRFSWKITIKKALKEAQDQELQLKRLRKKVLAEFLARGGDNKKRTDDELKALFLKKLTNNPMFKVKKDKVKLTK